MRGGPELVSSWIWSGSSTAGCSCCLAASSLHQMDWTGLPKTCTVSWRMCTCTPDTPSCIQPLLVSYRGSHTLPLLLQHPVAPTHIPLSLRTWAPVPHLLTHAPWEGHGVKPLLNQLFFISCGTASCAVTPTHLSLIHI